MDFYDTAEFIPFIDLSLFVSIEKGFVIRLKDTNQESCPFCVEISFFQIRQRNFRSYNVQHNFNVITKCEREGRRKEKDVDVAINCKNRGYSSVDDNGFRFATRWQCWLFHVPCLKSSVQTLDIVINIRMCRLQYRSRERSSLTLNRFKTDRERKKTNKRICYVAVVYFSFNYVLSFFHLYYRYIQISYIFCVANKR